MKGSCVSCHECTKYVCLKCKLFVCSHPMTEDYSGWKAGYSIAICCICDEKRSINLLPKEDSEEEEKEDTENVKFCKENYDEDNKDEDIEGDFTNKNNDDDSDDNDANCESENDDDHNRLYHNNDLGMQAAGASGERPRSSIMGPMDQSRNWDGVIRKTCPPPWALSDLSWS